MRVARIDIDRVRIFLGSDTTDAWVQSAIESLDVLLIDHANCEKKAAGTALRMLYRYVDRPDLLNALSKLAREELRHFEQVLGVMAKRGIGYRHLSPSRYAACLFDPLKVTLPPLGWNSANFSFAWASTSSSWILAWSVSRSSPLDPFPSSPPRRHYN